MTTPNPASVFGSRKVTAPPAPPKTQALVAKVEPSDPGKLVRPGFADVVESYIHDGVFKTKQLQPGQRVRAYVRDHTTGKSLPRGAERIVERANKIGDGEFWEVQWASGHPTSQHKAAYRWHDESMDGATSHRVVKQAALVPYEEV